MRRITKKAETPKSAADELEADLKSQVDTSGHEIDPEDPKGSAARAFLSQDGATCGELGVTELEVTWGGERFSPVQYHTFDVGPISVRIRPAPDELVNQVYRRAYEMVDRYGNQMFQKKLNDHLERVRIASASPKSKV